MIEAFKEHWFGFILSVMVFVCSCFVIVVGAAPHQDMKMRGFAPCTYAMATELGQTETKVKAGEVIEIVSRGFICYAQVMKEGMKLYLVGEQKTPWANYLFEPETLNDEFAGEAVEPFSEDLLKANLLDDEEDDLFYNDDDIKENDDDEKH